MKKEESKGHETQYMQKQTKLEKILKKERVINIVTCTKRSSVTVLNGLQT